MNYLKLLGFVAVTTLSLACGAHAEDCEGDTRQEHHVGNFNFVTNSWVEEAAGGRRRYVSCVANQDPGTDLPVNWIIPGPNNQYVPDTKATKTPRLRDDVNARPIAGCLKYGSFGEMTTAEFLGTAADEDYNKNGGGCGATPASGAAPEIQKLKLPADGYSDEFRIFFPSDPERPRETMLEVTGKVGIAAKDGSYESFLNYSARQYEGRPDGRVDAVSIRPFFTVNQEAFVAAYLKDNIEVRKMGEGGILTFQVFGDSNHSWRAVDAYYEFINEQGVVLASMPMPLLQDTGE